MLRNPEKPRKLKHAARLSQQYWAGSPASGATYGLIRITVSWLNRHPRTDRIGYSSHGWLRSAAKRRMRSNWAQRGRSGRLCGEHLTVQATSVWSRIGQWFQSSERGKNGNGKRGSGSAGEATTGMGPVKIAEPPPPRRGMDARELEQRYKRVVDLVEAIQTQGDPSAYLSPASSLPMWVRTKRRPSGATDRR